MKTPDEIKKGLARCKNVASCERCLNAYSCDLEADALAYIQQLEAAHRTEYCEDADYDCVELGKARKRIAELEAQVPKWISVEERLPEVSDVVLVIANGKPRPNITLRNAILIASFWEDEGWIADGLEGWDGLQVTHWMPLPGPPESLRDTDELPKEDDHAKSDGY